MPPRSLTLAGLFCVSTALQLHAPPRAILQRVRRRPLTVFMDEERGAKIAKLEATLKELDAAGIDQSVLEPLRKEMAGLKLADLRENIDALKSDMGSSPVQQVPAPPPPPPPSAFPRFPSPAALGVEGQRCAVLFYAYDGPKLIESLLETFEDEAQEFAACGCALVAVRRVQTGDPGDERKAGEYEERFPSFNFVRGLEELHTMPARLPPLGLEPGGAADPLSLSLSRVPLSLSSLSLSSLSLSRARDTCTRARARARARLHTHPPPGATPPRAGMRRL